MLDVIPKLDSLLPSARTLAASSLSTVDHRDLRPALFEWVSKRSVTNVRARRDMILACICMFVGDCVLFSISLPARTEGLIPLVEFLILLILASRYASCLVIDSYSYLVSIADDEMLLRLVEMKTRPRPSYEGCVEEYLHKRLKIRISESQQGPDHVYSIALVRVICTTLERFKQPAASWKSAEATASCEFLVGCFSSEYVAPADREAVVRVLLQLSESGKGAWRSESVRRLTRSVIADLSNS